MKSSIPTLLVLLALAACGDDDAGGGEPAGGSGSAGADAAIDEAGSGGREAPPKDAATPSQDAAQSPEDAAMDAAGGSSGEDDASATELACEAYDEEAEALLEAHASCERDEDCVIGPSAPCFFLCFTAVDVAQVDAFREEAEALADAYLESCAGMGFGCAIADCADPSDYHATCAAGRCYSERN